MPRTVASCRVDTLTVYVHLRTILRKTPLTLLMADTPSPDQINTWRVL